MYPSSDKQYGTDLASNSAMDSLVESENCIVNSEIESERCCRTEYPYHRTEFTEANCQ